jgi:hypothetical protein
MKKYNRLFNERLFFEFWLVCEASASSHAA